MLKKTEPVGDVQDIIKGTTGVRHRVLCVTPKISEIRTLDEFLGCPATHTPLMLNNACAVIAYGHGKPLRKAMAASTALELPLLYTDFGPFKRYSEKKDQALSMVFDHVGFAHASDRETYLESLIKQEPSAEQVTRMEKLIQRWKKGRVSRNHETLGPALPAERYVLLIDEDVAVAREHLIQAAKARFPSHKYVWLKDNLHAADAIENADAVFVHSSPLGFEALVWGTPLYVTGTPFYSGWQLTEDELPAPPRRGALPHGLAQLAHAYLVEYTRYIDPQTGERTTPERAIEVLEETRPEILAKAEERARERARLPRWLRWLVP